MKALHVLVCALCSDDFTVFAKAQVMTRDDSSGGWVPLGGGGMSAVGLRQFQQAALPLPPSAVVHGRQHVPYHQSTYRIYGQRLADRTVGAWCLGRTSSCFNMSIQNNNRYDMARK